jgi:hypothetical protein
MGMCLAPLIGLSETALTVRPMATETKKNGGAEKGADTAVDNKVDTETKGTDTQQDDTVTVAGAEAGVADDLNDEITNPDNPYDDGPVVAGRSGAGVGAAAVISGALGLISLTGSPLSDMVRERKQVVGQVSQAKQGGGGAGGDQIEMIYRAPWHAAAMVNGVLAFLAVVVGGVLLAAVARRVDVRTWVKGAAAGGVALGVIGLVVAGGMYFDLFGGWPSMPPMPQQPQTPTG